MNDLQQKFSEEENIDAKKWIRKVISNWYWFAICGLIGLVISYGLSRIKPEKHELSCLLLAERNTRATDLEDLFASQLYGANANLKNHIGVLNSYTIIKQTLINLDWRVFWFSRKHLKSVDLYKNSPLEVKEETGYSNIPEVPIHVTPLTDSTFIVSVESEVRLEGENIHISFEQQGKYGEVFSNSYFNFTLNKKEGQLLEPESHYYFIFKDLNLLKLSYKERLSITAFDDESDLIQLKLVGSNPRRETDFLNQFVDVYVNFELRKKNQISDNTIRFIDKQLGGIVDSLQTAGDDFTNFRAKNKIMNLNKEAELVVEQLNALEYEESQAKMRSDYYKNVQKYLDDAKQMEHMVAPSVVGITDPSLNALVVKLSELYSKRNAISSTITRLNPATIAIEKEINYTKQILDENLNSLISNVDIELRNFSDRKSALNYELTILPETEQNLINYKRKFDINNELYTYLMQKSAEAAITKASNNSGIQVLDYASMETTKFLGPNLNVNILLGLMIGLGVPFIVLIGIDFFSTTISGKEEIEGNTKIPIIGTIARNQHKNDLAMTFHPYSAFSESIRGLRTNLHFVMSQNNGSIISIHSSMPGEGKTFIAANLAASIAQNNKRVLLVGTDLRRPRIAKLFNIQSKTGLSNYLIKDCSFEDIVKNSSVKNLFVVPSGPIPPNPSELLNLDQFRRFVSTAQKQFDYILLDNAPIAMVTDPVIVGDLSDINLFVLRQNYTKKESLKIVDNYETLGTIKKIYLVLNDVKSDRFGYNKIYNKHYGKFVKNGDLRDEKKKKPKNVEIV